MSTYRSKNNLEVPLQSAYCQHHYTETAVLKVHNDILRSLDNEKRVFHILLDLSVAFDTVNQQTLQKCLQNNFNMFGEALQWLKSYVRGRHQFISIKGTQSIKKTAEI